MARSLVFIGFVQLLLGVTGMPTEQNGLVTFFVNSNFSGSSEVENFTPGCRELTPYFVSNTVSLHPGGNCIRVFSERRCRGNYKDYTEADHHLGFWADKIISWRPCADSSSNETQSAPVGGRATFFAFDDFFGYRQVVPVDTYCHELPSSIQEEYGLRSLDTGESCIRVFTAQGCTGESKEFNGIYNSVENGNSKWISWQGCSVDSIMIPVTIPWESRLDFYYYTDSAGPAYITNYSVECRELRLDFIGHTQSLNSHEKCVTIYTEPGCTGKSKDYYPGSPSHHDLQDFNNQVKSWKGCPNPKDTEEWKQQFAFYTLTNFRGSEHTANYTPGCHDLPPEFSANTQSINTHDKCVRVFAQDGCTGELRDYYPGSPNSHHDLQDWNDRIRSWEMCPACLQPGAEANQTNQCIKFYTGSHFHGGRFVAEYDENDQSCQELSRGFRGETQSLQLGDKCIRAFTLGECSGDYLEFSGDISDLGSWSDKIRSWESCSVSPNRTILGYEGRVTFFVKREFAGYEHTANYSSTGCQNLSEDLQANSESLITGGKCIRAFLEEGCTGINKEYLGEFHDLEDWNEQFKSWESCEVPKVNGSDEYVAFFYYTGFRGHKVFSSYTAGCHDLPDSMQANSRSIKAENKCISAFGSSGCRGDNKEFTGSQTSLNEWNDKIVSWRMCSPPSGSIVVPAVPQGGVSFFEKADYSGSSYVDNYTPGCHVVRPYFNRNIESLNVDGKCVKVFAEIRCTGESREFYPGSPEPQNDLQEWNKKIRSWRQCSMESNSTDTRQA